MKILCKQLFVFLISFLVFTSLKSQNQDDCLTNKRDQVEVRSNEEILLEYRPIQGNIVISETRNERIKLIVRESKGISRIEAEVSYASGKEQKVGNSEFISFWDNGENGDEVADDLIFTSDEFTITYENWIENYWRILVNIDLDYYDQSSTLIGEEDYNLLYFIVNSTLLSNLQPPKINYLTQDSTIVHIGNALYVEFEENIKKHISQDRHFSVGFYDEEQWMEDVYKDIWGETFFAFPGTGELGLADLNSNVYSFPLNGGSGNYYFFNNKTGNTAFAPMLTTGTTVHELFHMFQPYFFDYLIDDLQGNPFYKIGTFAHNPVQFFGQSGYGLNYPLPRGYPNLCPEHINEIDTIEGGYEVTVYGPCDTTGLNLVDGIALNVYSNFELFTMDLIGKEALDSVMYFGFNPTQIPDGVIMDSVTWRFEKLVNVTRDEMDQLKEQWYDREGGKFRPYYDAVEKNMLISFHGSGRRTNSELKFLHFLSDELVSKEIKMDLADWQMWGYQNDYYNRYISYEQATMGLGKLTNNFPLPPGIDPCGDPDTIEINGIDICAGETTKIAIGPSYVSYQWSTGDTTMSIMISDPGTYSVTVTDTAGCKSIFISSIVILPPPEVSIVATPVGTTGDSTRLDAGMGFISYLWSTGEVGQSIIVDAAGTYTVTVIDVNGCVNTSSYSVSPGGDPNPMFVSPPPDITVSCIEEVPQLDELTWNDDNGNTGSVQGEEQSDGALCPETIARSWMYSDTTGNSISHTQVIVVNDLETPVISDLPPDVTISCGEDIPLMQDITWTDNCDGAGTVTGIDDYYNNFITRTWTYTDGCGNTATAQQVITLTDTSIVTVYDTVTVMDTTFVTIYDTVSIAVTDTLYIEVATTGTNNAVVKGEIKVFPNPSNEIVIIEFREFNLFTDFILEIINVNGTQVYNTSLSQEQIEIPVSEIGPPGTYFINIQNEKRELVAVKTLILF